MVLDAFCSASLAKKKSKVFEILDKKIGKKINFFFRFIYFLKAIVVAYA